MADPGHEFSDGRIEAIAEQLRSIYAEASEGAERGLAEWLESFAEKDADMRSKVEAGEMTERQWRDWRRHQMIQGRRWRELKQQLAEGFTTANEQAAQIISGELPAIAAENANWAAFSVEKAAGVGTSFALQDAGTVHALLSEAAGLSVATVAVNAAADIAWNRKGIQSALTQGIMLGESIPKMAKRMRRVGATNQAQAVRWARTFATAAENAGRVASYERAQKMGIGLQQEWIATLDARTRHSHRQLDGERREVGGTFSNGCRYPGDPQAPYAEVCNCRCTLVAAVEGIDQSKADRWSRLPEGMTYEEWKGERKAEAERSPTVGEVIVGKVRTELHRVKRAVEKYAEAQRVFGLTAPGFSPRPRKPIKLKGAEEAIFRREYNTHYAARYKGKGIVTTYVGSYGYIIKPVDFDEFEVLDRWLIP